MKKFAVVMITIMVLLIFLVLNYLLWDKENLMKQSESDRIEQDWLRGQNRTLQTTVEEQEQTIKNMKQENSKLSARISNLEQELELLNSKVESYRKEIDRKNEAIANYKLFTENQLLNLTAGWFDFINRRDYENAWKCLAQDHLVFGKKYSIEDFSKQMGAIHSISIRKKEDKEGVSGFAFEILKNYGNDYEVTVLLDADVTLDRQHNDEASDWKEGTNRIRVTFEFNPDVGNWAIKTVSKAGN
jgi:hypothetical protein